MSYFNFQPSYYLQGVANVQSKIDFGKDLQPIEVDFPQDLYGHYRPQQFFATVFLSRPAVSPRLAQALAGGPPGSQLMAVAA
jgi:hypothetical protein